MAGLADLAHLKVQTPLPETANEVCEVACAIGADVANMRIGARATETEIERLSAAAIWQRTASCISLLRAAR